MADVSSRLYNWSTNEASNAPLGSTTIGAGLDDNLRQIQATVRAELSKKGSDIASAATTDLGATAGSSHDITGTTTITAFGTVDSGIWKVLQFNATVVLKYNASSLILPAAVDITAVPTDCLYAYSLGSGNWRVPFYQKANGKALVNDDLNFTQTSVASTADLMPIWASTNAANRSITAKNFLNVLNQVSVATPDLAADYVFLYDVSGGTMAKATPASLSTVTGQYATLLATKTVGSATTQVAFTSSDFDWTLYDEYELHIIGMQPTTTATTLSAQVSVNAGSTWQTGAGEYTLSMLFFGSNGTNYNASGTGSYMFLVDSTQGQNSTSNKGFYGKFKICSPANAAVHKQFPLSEVSYLQATTGAVVGGMGCNTWTASTQAITGIRFLYSSGTVAAGKILAYGVRNT